MPIVDNINIVNVIIDNANLLNAEPHHVLRGHMFVGKQKQMTPGTIEILPKLDDSTILAGENYTVREGYNPKSYNVVAENLNSQTAATAMAGEIIKDKTAWVNGNKVVGTMEKYLPSDTIIDPGETHTVPPGYHNGTTVTGKSLADIIQDSTAVEEDVAVGEVFYSQGERKVGSLNRVAPEQIVLNPGTSHRISVGIHSGAGIVSAKPLSEVTIGTAVMTDIAEGKIAWVNGRKVVGNIPRIAASEVELSLNGVYKIPRGFHTGDGRVKQSISSMAGITVSPGRNPIVVETQGKVLTGNITVTGVSAFDRMRYTDEDDYIVNQGISITDSGVSRFTTDINISVHNWCDNRTSNVFYTTLGILDGSNQRTEILEGHQFVDTITKNEGYIPVTGNTFPVLNHRPATLRCVIDTLTIQVEAMKYFEGLDRKVFFRVTLEDTTGTAIPDKYKSLNIRIKNAGSIRIFGEGA